MQYLPKVLLVEDDRSIAGALAHALRSTYDISVAGSGAMALYKSDTEDFDMIVLDLNLPDVPGMMICEQLRNRGATAPILILSADTRVLTKINLLDAGANDYLGKPFSLGELKARLRALNRISYGKTAVSKVLLAGGLELNHQTYEVNREGTIISLRRKEFAILECLMLHAGSVVSRDQLMHTVWRDSSEVWTNTVDVHINHLRDKIDRPFDQPLIRTAHGRGYKLENLKLALAKED